MKIALHLIIICFITSSLFAQDYDYQTEYQSYYYGHTLLYYANYGFLDSVKNLVEYTSVDVNFKDEEGITALMLAAQGGYTDLVYYLITKDALIDQKSNDFHFTPLILAVKNDYLKTAETLIRNGAGIDSLDIYGRTALHYAVAFGYYNTADMLLYYDADPNITDITGSTPITYAIQDNDTILINMLLLENAGIDFVTNDGMNAIHIAAYNGNLDFIKKYQQYFNIQDDLDNDGMNAVDFAVAGGQSEVLKWFVDSGYKVRDKISEIYTPRTLARSSKDPVTKKLIRKMGIKDIHYPYFRRLSFGYDFIFNKDNFFMSANLGLYEDRYGFSGELGYVFHGKERIIFHEFSENEIYQLRERRNGIYIGLAKDFKIFNLEPGSYLSLFLKIRSIIFWGKYDGMDIQIPNEIISWPGIGIALNSPAHFKIFYETSYMELPVYNSASIFFTIGMKGLINLRKSKTDEKYKYIINY